MPDGEDLAEAGVLWYQPAIRLTSAKPHLFLRTFARQI
jgi:hypothetical protein